jgi:DNA-binding CsgD family transcriptional regulator
MIHIISDDTYFSLGLSEILERQEIKNIITAADLYQNIEKKINYGDVIFLSTENDDIARSFLNMCNTIKLKLILVIDMLSINTYRNAWECEIISKKIPVDIITRHAITQGIVEKVSKPSLTKQELRVMSALSDGITIAKLSHDMRLSIKTISGYKISALKKMGLNPRNILSIFIYRNIFQVFSHLGYIPKNSVG